VHKIDKCISGDKRAQEIWKAEQNNFGTTHVRHTTLGHLGTGSQREPLSRMKVVKSVRMAFQVSQLSIGRSVDP